jgi:hypothetical protein
MAAQLCTDRRMFTLEALPASYGDCLLVEYGTGTKLHRMLIDGGPLQSLPALQRRLNTAMITGRWIDLLVLTHVDADHVEGLIRILGEQPCRITPREIWFNGWRELNDHRALSTLQGEFFSALIARRFGAKLNRRWDGAAVVVPIDGTLPARTLDGGMRLTLLSPTSEKLATMRASWEREVKAKKLSPGDLDRAWERLLANRSLRPRAHAYLAETDEASRLVEERFRSDDAPANGSSIAFLAEREDGGSCLFLGDAHSDAVMQSLNRLLAERGIARLYVDAVKLSHHGSRYNFDPNMLRVVESPRFIVSTDGSRFSHPDEEVIEAIIAGAAIRPPQLLFNYRCATTERWASPTDQAARGYRAEYAASGASLSIALA